ncbi:MAG TPA: AraC family transcriptional regulator [Armatimonadota bacterium]|jgi:AraC-like DNA-binding protein
MRTRYGVFYDIGIIPGVDTMSPDKCLRQTIFDPGDFPVLVSVNPVSRDHSYYSNYHSEFEFHLIRHGNGEYFIRDAKYPVEKNSVLLMHKNEVHCYIPKSSSHVKNITLIFGSTILRDRPLARSAMGSLASLHHLVLSDTQAARTELLLNEIAAECRHKGLHWQKVVGDLLEIFLVIVQRAASGSVSDMKTGDPIIQDVIRYLDETYTEKPSLADVASHFCLSSFTLSKKFKQYVGLGFREYLIHRRIVEAQRLLDETEMKIAAIAYQVGFESLSAFNSNFLRLSSVTPVVYRKIALANRDPEITRVAAEKMQ